MKLASRATPRRLAAHSEPLHQGAVTGNRVTGGTTTLTRVAMGDGFNLVGPGPANLRPGHSGWVTLSYGDGCPALNSGGKARYRTLFIALDGGRMRVDFPAALNLVCGLEASRFGAPPPAPRSSRSPLNVLTATVTMRATLSAGATASYTVTLRNHSGRRYCWRPAEPAAGSARRDLGRDLLYRGLRAFPWISIMSACLPGTTVRVRNHPSVPLFRAALIP